MNRVVVTKRSALLSVGVALAMVGSGRPASAEVKLPAIFGSHMVLQRDQKDRIWGQAEPGEEVTVCIAGQSRTAKAGPVGYWSVELDPMPAGGPLEMTVSGKNTVKFEDVLIGEVWLCSGQSNMQWPVSSATDPDLVIPTADHPTIRLISVPQVGTQEPQSDFQGRWQPCTPETSPACRAQSSRGTPSGLRYSLRSSASATSDL